MLKAVFYRLSLVPGRSEDRHYIFGTISVVLTLFHRLQLELQVITVHLLRTARPTRHFLSLGGSVYFIEGGLK